MNSMTQKGDGAKEETEVKYYMSREGFYVGQEGEFLIHDSLKRPIERIRGKIITLMGGKTASLYAMVQTERGMRPGRLL